MIEIIFVLSVALLAFAVLMSIRNEWTYKKLMELNRFENGVHLIREYEDYFHIFTRFWVWDIEKFKKNNSLH